MRHQAGIKPELVAGRNDPDSWNRVSMIDNSRHIIAIDCFRDCSTEICGSEPGFLIDRYRGAWNLIEPELLRVSGGACVTNRNAVRRKLFKDRRRDGIDQMYFAALVAHGFNFRVLFNIQSN